MHGSTVPYLHRLMVYKDSRLNHWSEVGPRWYPALNLRPVEFDIGDSEAVVSMIVDHFTMHSSVVHHLVCVWYGCVGVLVCVCVWVWCVGVCVCVVCVCGCV